MMLAGTRLRWFKARYGGVASVMVLASAVVVNPAWNSPAQAQTRTQSQSQSQAQTQVQQDDVLEQSVSQPVVQAVPSMDTMTLNAALNRVAQNPRDANALIDAGNAAMTLGDTDASIGFFRRAGQIAPLDGRVKAGLAGAYVRNGDPFSAIPLFDAAEQAGASSAEMLSDRGLAFDLVGNGPKAQAYYRAALARGANDEVQRRLALSLAISGDSRGSAAALSPLLVRQDKAAWRTKAFALAILGQTEEAVTLTRSTMPPSLAAAMSPYLRYMRTLTPAQQASAANLGQFPRASEIGRVDPRMAVYAPLRPVALALVDAGQQGSGRNGRGRRSSDSQSGSMRPSAAAQVASAASQQSRRPNSILPAVTPRRVPALAVDTTVTRPVAVAPAPETKVSATASPAIQPPRVAAVLPPVAPPVLAQPAAPASAPAPSLASAPVAVAVAVPAAVQPPLAAAAVPPPTPVVAAAPAATPAAATPAPALATVTATAAPTPAPTAVATVAATPAPGFTSLGTGAARSEVAAFDLARATPPAAVSPPAAPLVTVPVVAAAPSMTATPTEASPVAVAAAPLPSAIPAPPAEPVAAPAAPPPPAPPVVPQPSRTQSLAEAFSEFAAPVGEATPAPGAVDIRRIRPVRELSPEMRAAQLAAKTPPPPSHPSRIWVQVATGRDRTALAGDWRRMARQSAELFRNRKANVTAWGQSNRLLAGPFETEAGAVTFVAQLRRADVPGAFVWTSPAGQVVDAVGGK